MKKFLLAVAAIAIAIPCAAQAADKAQGPGPNPYTECGIGAAIFQDINWAAAISNVIWDLGTTAITSAVSSPEMCNEKKMNTAGLILETLPELEKEVAMGEGEYVVALAQTMGCADTGAVASSMRTGYAGVVSDADYAAKSDVERAASMYNVARDAANSASCGTFL